MVILINNKRTLNEIQNEFHLRFPNLKIIFFRKKHMIGETSEKTDEIKPGLTLEEARARHNNGHVTIYPHQTVDSLEELFEEKFGLYAQVMRRSGKVWLVTSKTDEWTLAKQNEIGGEVFSEI
ncbi:MAG: hypothetical protein IAF38_17895 [Bacteroidia bacterium]|nr:hypothetical protein [Bacteroidia bacterium]